MRNRITFAVFILISLFPGYTMAQLVTISGYVRHAITDAGIENASVFEKRSEIGTISNKDGFFKLMLHQGKQNISFSEPGYKSFSESIILKSDTTLIIRLKPEVQTKSRHKNDSELQAGITSKKSANDDKRFHLFR